MKSWNFKWRFTLSTIRYTDVELNREIWLEKKDLKICPTIGKTVQGERQTKEGA